MTRPVQRILILLMVLSALFYGGFLGISLLRFSTEGLLEIYLWPWSIKTAVLALFDSFIPLTVCSVLLGFSFLFLSGALDRQRLNSFTQMATSLVLLFLILATVNIIIAEGFAPGMRADLDEYYGKSSFAEGSLDEAKNSRNKGEYKRAILYFDYYLSIDPDNKDVQQQLEESVAAFELSPEQERAPQRSIPEYSKRLMNQSAGDLVRAAEKFLNARDYYSAHYYATVAGEIEPGRKDAARIAAEAWNRISEAEFSREAQEAGDLFRLKRAAYSALNRGDHIKAYYLFHDLAENYPLDSDIQNFSEIAREEVEKGAFFMDELEQIKALPGRHGIYFINSRQKGIREFVYFDRFVPLGVVAYAYGVEILGQDADGNIAYHLAAPAAKITQQTDAETGEISVSLMLKAIDRDNSSNSFDPENLVPGSKEDFNSSLRVLQTPISKISGYSQTDTSLKLQYIHQLLALRPDYVTHGYHTGKIEIEIIMRLLNPFTMLILGFLALALGWSLRVQNRKKWYHYLLMPVLVAAVFQLYSLYQYLSRLAYLYILLQTGFILTLVTAVMVQALLLGLILLLVAKQEHPGRD